MLGDHIADCLPAKTSPNPTNWKVSHNTTNCKLPQNPTNCKVPQHPTNCKVPQNPTGLLPLLKRHVETLFLLPLLKIQQANGSNAKPMAPTCAKSLKPCDLKR